MADDPTEVEGSVPPPRQGSNKVEKGRPCGEFLERKKPFPGGFFASFREVCASFLGEQFVKWLFLKIFEWGFDGASKEPAELFFCKGIGSFSFCKKHLSG